MKRSAKTWALSLGLGLAALPVGGVLADRRTPAERAHAAFEDNPFRLASDCSPCHANSPNATAMRDSAGRDVAPFELWQGTMMANSGRDPYWRATLSAEIATFPARRSELEDKCTRCHQPMASSSPGQGDNERHWSPDKVDGGSALADYALDGVSCAVCHSILPNNLGTEDSFTGGYHIDDEDRMFGPHQVTFTGPMFAFTGKLPVFGAHMANNSGLCASCHTLFTKTLRPDGTASGHDYAEQTPYLEWRNSIFQNEVAPVGPSAASCQDCHVPKESIDGVPIQTKIARNPMGFDYNGIPARSPFGRHVFVGGNYVIPRVLRDNPTALRVNAPSSAFDATIQATLDQLRNDTARVTVPSISRDGDRLDVVVRIENLCGHKYPSGYPARRAWLRVRVHDASQNLVWSSGEHDAEGRLVDTRGSVLPSELAGGPVLTHKDVVNDPNDPQVFEVVMADEHGNPTFRLLSAASNLKDDRLLPQGWSASHPDATTTAPAGLAGDPNFTGGADEVTFQVPAPLANGPYTVTVDLLHQPIAPRWASELFTVNTPEITAFRGYWNNTPRTPALVGTATASGN
ncbi:MAG: hypothetical protein AB7I19_05345 [Planctomycetota bacterium]